MCVLESVSERRGGGLLGVCCRGDHVCCFFRKLSLCVFGAGAQARLALCVWSMLKGVWSVVRPGRGRRTDTICVLRVGAAWVRSARKR